ncbi:unnamed protein product [Cylindrotheca closterium]|uniref:G-protein coupled receptors family 3 profile domain-containing protein n=1 Tax=Cylindrotheca closterium TaxID=2856 RepID=A0AAD2CBX6_9STRA|nr:unnamed protein product [Cylindrotheca closterium]
MVSQSVETRRLQTDTIETSDGDDSDTSCCATCSSAPQQYVRIATWPTAAETLKSYANMYNSLHKDALKILVDTIPSIRDLQDSIELTKTSLAIDSHPRVDGYVVPPMLLGTLSEELASLDFATENYLPIYEHLTTVDGTTAAIPLFAGNQLLLFYKKDLLEANELGDEAPPNTWDELTEFAKKLDGDGSVTGLCLGRMSEHACRQRSSITGMPCHSQSMSYWSMVLASLAQSAGASSGWLFNVKLNGKIVPLLNQTLQPALNIIEEQLQYGGADALESDSLDNLKGFRQGACAMTILGHHPLDLLKDPNVGVALLPGSSMVLDRPAAALRECTYRSCPHGRVNPNKQGEGVNRAPIGALDIAMGTILDASNHKGELKEFFDFVEEHRSLNDEMGGGRQPLTYDELRALTEIDPDLQAYAGLIETTTSDPNVAWPLTIPGSFDLLSELDQQVYNYLVQDNHTADASKDLVRKVDRAWGIRMQQQDSRVHATPLSILYQRSLQGVVTEEKIDLYIGIGFRLVCWAMGGFACLLSIAFAIWVYVNLDQRVVKASQPLFLWLVCAGAFIMASSIFPFGIEDDIVSYRGASISCMSSMWLYALGFVMMVSALYSKIWRINRIFRYAHKIRQIRIEKKHIMVPFGFLFSINFLLLVIWTIVDPYEWIREEANPGFTNGFCNSDHYWAFIAMLVFANLLVACYTLIQAFECRKLSTEYGESNWIGFSLAFIVQVWLIGLPILQLTGTTPDWLFLTKTCIVFFSCVSTLLCVFIPKIQYLRDEATKEDNERQLSGSGRTSMFGAVVKPFQSGFGMIRMGSQYMISRSSQHNTSENMEKRKNRTSGVIGIRIVRASGEYAQDMEKLQKNLKTAESRRRMLQDQLEGLQEQFEQYIISHHPHGAHVGAHMDALANSERTK